MNRSSLQNLANERIKDAEALLMAGRWSGSYYLAGYAVECALKECFAKQTREYDFPQKSAQKTVPPNIARSNRANLTQAVLVVRFWLPRLQIDIVAASELHFNLFMPTNNRPSSCHGHASSIWLATTARILSDADARSTFQPAVLC